MAALKQWLDQLVFWTNRDRVRDFLYGVIAGVVLGTAIAVLSITT